MRVVKWCGILALCTALPLPARAQRPDDLPTMPALPITVPCPIPAMPYDSGPPYDWESAPPFGPYVAPIPPGLIPVSYYPPPEADSRGCTPELEPPRYYAPMEAPPYYVPAAPPPYSPPPGSYQSENVPIRSTPTFGQRLYALFHPFRRSGASAEPTEPAHEPASQAETAAAAIRADEQCIERRKTAIRYLAGVDCAFNPEAEAGLLTALRCDRHECVRYEAALALNNRWCWTSKTLAALNQAMSGGSADGHPCERSDRVRLAAWRALCSYAAATQPQPNRLSPQMPQTAVRRASFEVPAADTQGMPARTPELDYTSLPPLRPIGRVPEVEPQQPSYEPTPLEKRQ